MRSLDTIYDNKGRDKGQGKLLGKTIANRGLISPASLPYNKYKSRVPESFWVSLWDASEPVKVYSDEETAISHTHDSVRGGCVDLRQ